MDPSNDFSASFFLVLRYSGPMSSVNVAQKSASIQIMQVDHVVEICQDALKKDMAPVISLWTTGLHLF